MNLQHYQQHRRQFSLPPEHTAYLEVLRDQGLRPEVILDIGSCCLHWHDQAVRIWPQARIICFDAMKEFDEFYRLSEVEYHLGLLSQDNDVAYSFYQNYEHPAGNSYYRENSQINPRASEFYSDLHRTFKFAHSLDTVMQQRGFPAPDMIKMDVQGAELDILRGAVETLKTVKNIIAEVQSVEYNQGAPLEQQVIEYIESQGFVTVNRRFSGNQIQGDAHWSR